MTACLGAWDFVAEHAKSAELGRVESSSVVT